jgi:hypothetical protein
MAMSELKQRLLIIELKKLGFTGAKYFEQKDAVITDPSADHEMGIRNDGSVFYYAEHDHIAHDVRAIAKQVNEIVDAWEKASAVPVEDISHYRVLSEYNNIVLAARDDSEHGYGIGLTFVTWRYNYDRTGLEHGNYTEDYEDAKEDFAVRCGLVDKQKLFNETELKLIYQGLVQLVFNSPDLTTEQSKLLDEVVERIEILVPEICAHEQLEELGLVPDDELEI